MGARTRAVLCQLFALSAVGVASCSGPDHGETVATGSSALCSTTTLSATSAGPVAIGTVVGLTAASPSCAAGETPEYRFMIRRDGAAGGYTEIRGYSSLATADFNTAGLPSGKYTVLVYSRAIGRTTNDSSASVTVFVGSTCTATTLTTTPPSPQQAGAPIGLSASTTCSFGGTPEYRFLVAPPGGAFAEVSGWGPLPASWPTSGLAVGPYALRIYARAMGNVSSSEALSTISYRIGDSCSAVSGALLPPQVAAPGDDVLITGNATCTNGSAADYQFSYRPSGATAWQIIRTWGAAGVTWPTAGLAAGAYQLLIEARANDYAGPKQASRTVNYTLGGFCSGGGLSVTQKAPQPIGAVLRLTGSATCSGAIAEYRFFDREPLASAYTEIAPWSEQATFDWDTVGRTPGNHSLLVEVRAKNSGTARQTYKALTYAIGDICNKVTLAATPLSPQPAGTAIALTASATCNFGGVPEYRFSRRLGAADWLTFRDWSGSGLANMSSAGLGEGAYELRVEARGQGHPLPESARSLAYAFSAACAPGYAPNGAGGCVDVDECDTDNGGCDLLTTCTNTPGSFGCGPCPSGYTGTGETGCVEIPPPAPTPCTPNPCQNGGACAANGAAFTCTCTGGYGGTQCDVAPATLLVAGDVADCATTTDTATGLLLDAHAGAIALLGDAAYPNGTAANFTSCFEPVWGRHKSRIRPVPGNHEYDSANAAPYFAYFGAAAGDPSKGYYSYDLGTWHIVALNSNCTSVACSAGSAQETWLRQDLAAHPSACTLAYWHHPRFSSGEHGNATNMSAIWQALVDGGVELALAGHDHDYERFQAQNDSASATASGVVQFVVGTGGVALRSFGTIRPNSLVREGATHGVLELTLNAGSYAWNFVPVAGKTFTDSGVAACH